MSLSPHFLYLECLDQWHTPLKSNTKNRYYCDWGDKNGSTSSVSGRLGEVRRENGQKTTKTNRGDPSEVVGPRNQSS